jgi:hypothetical protein
LRPAPAGGQSASHGLRTRGADPLSALPESRRSASDVVAGLLAAGSIFVGAIGVIQTPVRIIPISIVLAFVSVVMADRSRSLAAWAVALNAVWWLLGMTVAITTDHPLY